MSITDILSRKLPIAKVVASASYNANMVVALYHCSNIHCIKFGGEMYR